MPTHGSMTKAGKVRSHTPKVVSQNKKKLSPKARNLHNYVSRITHPRTDDRFSRRPRRR